jgi:uncharacterized protein YjdB
MPHQIEQGAYMSLIRRLRASATVLFLASFTLVACGGGNSNSPQPDPVATGITLSGYNAAADFIEGQTRQLQARLDLDNGTSEAIDAADLTWSSSDTSVVTVDSQGLLTAVAPGNAVIDASADGLGTSLSVVVVPREIVELRFSTDGVALNAGNSFTFGIFAIFNDQTQEELDGSSGINLVSSNPAVFVIDNSNFGRIISQTPGTGVLSASTGTGIEATTQVLVEEAALASLMLSADALSQPAGIPINASALGTFSDGSQRDVTSDVTWAVSGISGAQVTNAGVITSNNAGTATVTATSNGVQGVLQVTFSEAVLQGVTIQSGDGIIPLGRTLQATLRGTFSDGSTATISGADWAAENSNIITVDGSGLITAVALGESTITATSGTFSASATIRVTEAVLEGLAIEVSGLTSGSLPLGFQANASATGTYSDGRTEDLTNAVVWSFDPSAVATVGPTGIITSQGVGVGELTANYLGLSDSLSLEVTPAVLESVRISMASLVDGQVSKAKGLSEPVSLIGNFSDGNEVTLPFAEVTWTINDLVVATVTAGGEVQFLEVGTTTLEAQYQGFSDVITLVTSDAIPLSLVITQAPTELNVATTEALAATVTYSDTSEVDVTESATWVSSDPTIAAVLQGGGEPTRLRGVSTGVVDVTASATIDGVSLSDATLVTVLPSVLTLELFQSSFFGDGEWVACGSSEGSCNISSSSSLSVLPRPEWFTIQRFRVTAGGRDWVVDNIAASNSNPSVDVRVVGLTNGEVIPKDQVVEFELQIQPTSGAQVSNALTIDVIGNNGDPTRIITATYTITTN